MRRQRRDGVCLAYSKADGSAYALARHEYPRLRAAWQGGAAFFEGDAFYGGILVLRLADIVAVSDVTPEAIAARMDDDRENDREDSVFA